ncbi:hypothetical protein CPT_Merlin6 [Citrobacter phage Merlin]|uniref:Uncharacterized protein n=1 Tax=Citrobacter phage Merlin TaxID=1675602 RepID=A0A0K1LM99_9CAUD|nr:hypothetical protein CPT_Merlin6 [Citrobacter phage Merlin]AKU43652.1 hypothetical protein CPT_Merlin6 [Citrobacter phage Merlin]
MIFGLTTAQKQAKAHLEVVERAIGRYRFAWWPTRITTGQTIWLQKYYEVEIRDIVIQLDKTYGVDTNITYAVYAYSDISKADWKIFEAYKQNYGLYYANKCHKEIKGNEAFDHLIRYKAELNALLNP